MKFKKESYKSVRELVHQNADSDEQQFVDEFDKLSAERRVITHLMALRAARGKSQADIAKSMGCSQSRVSKIESSRDGDLRLSDLRDYLHAIDHSLMFVVGPKRWPLFEQIKFHASMISSCLRGLVKVAGNDPAIGAGVSSAHVQTLYKLIGIVLDSAKNLPHFSNPMPAIMDVEDLPDEQSDDCWTSGGTAMELAALP